MIRTPRVLALGAAVLAAGVLLSPVGPVRVGAVAQAAGTSSLDLFTTQAAADGGGDVDYLPVNSRGKTKPEFKDDRVILTFPMYELATGKVIGTVVDDIKSPIPGFLFDVTTYFKFADGELTNHMLVSSAPDVQRPGWIIVGNRPTANSLTNATGSFARRTGKIRLSGVNDLTKFPNEVYQDDFWVIELNK
jgi:hypothetical protein